MAPKSKPRCFSHSCTLAVKKMMGMSFVAALAFNRWQT